MPNHIKHIGTLGAIAAGLTALSLFAAITPDYSLTLDSSTQSSEYGLVFNQASSQKLSLRFTTDGTTAQDLTGATAVLFYYTPSDRAWMVTVTGAVDTATNGQVSVTFTPSNLNTNSGTSTFNWQVDVSDADETLAWARGKLRLVENIGASGAGALTTSTNVNWINFRYSNTANYGPYRAGTNISFSANADGSVDINADATDTTALVTTQSLHTTQIATISNDLDTAETATANLTTTQNLHRTYINTISNDLDTAEATLATAILQDGSRAMTGDFNVDGNSITAASNVTATATIQAEQLTSTDDIAVGDDLNMTEGGKVTLDNDKNTYFTGLDDRIDWVIGGSITWQWIGGLFTGASVGDPFLRGKAGGDEDSPAYAITGDTDIGMYRVAADTLGFSTHGTNRLTIADTAITSAVDVVVEGQIHAVASDFADTMLAERNNRTSDILWAANRTLATKTSNMGDGFGCGMSFNIQDDAGVQNVVAVVGAVREGADNTGAIVFQPSVSGTATERMRIVANGRVGIGTNAPATKLEVVGDVRITQATTNSCTFEFWSPSNRWASVQRVEDPVGTWTTNVVFVSP